MRTITIKTAIENSNIPAKLIRSVVRNMGGIDSMNEQYENVCHCGASGGFGNFVYYSDTVNFTKKNRKEILELLESQSKEYGTSTGEILTSFNCFKGYSESEIWAGIYNAKSDDRTTIYNGLAWFALEEVARAFDYVSEM